MFTKFVTYTVSALLLVMLFSFTGTITFAFTGQQSTDICCDGSESDRGFPENSGECADTECRCLFCEVPSFLSYNVHLISTEMSGTIWRQITLASSEYIRDIEYPPEFS
jgi:hypothetical protein